VRFSEGSTLRSARRLVNAIGLRVEEGEDKGGESDGYRLGGNGNGNIAGVSGSSSSSSVDVGVSTAIGVRRRLTDAPEHLGRLR
jgi:hypothetical protein